MSEINEQCMNSLREIFKPFSVMYYEDKIERKFNFSISLERKVHSFDVETGSELIKVFADMRNDIESVTFISEKFRFLEKEIMTLKETIDELRKYETHYNIEMKLRHGEK